MPDEDEVAAEVTQARIEAEQLAAQLRDARIRREEERLYGE